jgi:thymidylate synthase (FAD)
MNDELKRLTDIINNTAPTSQPVTFIKEADGVGSVTLEQSMGSDLMIVRAARVSLNRDTEWEYLYFCEWCGQSYKDQADACDPGECSNPPSIDVFSCKVKELRNLQDKDLKVLKSLIRNHHASPFEHSSFTFRVSCPIKIARDWFRHRTHSFNEWSTRYSKIDPEFYVPRDEYMRTQVGKPMDYNFEPLKEPWNEISSVMMIDTYNMIYERYEYLLELGVAKEVASFILPMGIMTSFYDTVNLRNLWAFLNLRGPGTGAILEMQELAAKIESLARPIYPEAWAAWEECGRPTL